MLVEHDNPPGCGGMAGKEVRCLHPGAKLFVVVDARRRVNLAAESGLAGTNQV